MKLNPIAVSDLKTGDTLLYEKTIVIGRIEQIITRSKFNHSSIVQLVNGIPYVYEAIAPKFIFRPLTESVAHTKFLVVQRPLFSIDGQKVESLSQPLIGKEYYYLGLWHQLMHQLYGGWKGNRDPNKPYCSKYNAWVYNQLAGIYTDWYKTSPDELFENRVDFSTFEIKLPL